MSQDDERLGGPRRPEATDPVAEAAALLGPELRRYLQTDPSPTPGSADPDDDFEDPTAAFETPAALLDRATLPQPSPIPMAVPVLDVAPPPAPLPVPAPMRLRPTPVVGPRTLPPRRHTDPLPRPTPPSLPVAVARPVVVGPPPKPVPVATPVSPHPPKVERDRARRRPTAPLTAGIRQAPPSDPPEPSVILDFGGESEAVTTIFTDDSAPELPRGRLAVASGPNQGKVWYLNRPVTRLGRAQENDIVLLDGSVSRHHLRIERHPEGFRLLDSRSVNGVWVNGVKTGRHELYDGDRVLLGEMTLTFSTVGRARVRPSLRDRVTDPGKAVARPGQRRRRVPLSWLLVWIATTLVAVAVTVSVTRVVRHRRAQAVADQAEAHRLEARSAVEQRAWGRARTELDAARTLAPTLLDYQAELARLDQAERHEQAIVSARKALASGDARTALERLTLVGPNSPYAVDARTLRQQAHALARP